MKKLIDICDIQYGYAFDSAYFTENSCYPPLARIRDVKRGYSETYYSGGYSEEYILASGDLLVGMDGEFNIARWKCDGALLNQRVCRLLAKKGTNEEYLRFAMMKVLKEIERRTAFVTVKHLSAKELNKLQLVVPDLSTQNKVAEILSRLEKIIGLRRQELKRLDDLIKARFVELFVGKKYEIVKAGSIIKEMRNGVSPSTSGGHFEKVLTLSAITQGKFDDKAWKEGFFTDCPSAEKRITEDDFYICRGNGNKSLVGMGVYALENRPDLVFPDTVIAAHIDTERMVLPYLWIMWQQPEVRKQLESGARTTNGTYKINQKVISEIKIICPPINEQEVFADFVKQVNKSKVKVQKALDETQKLFDSLMQQYFG